MENTRRRRFHSYFIAEALWFHSENHGYTNCILASIHNVRNRQVVSQMQYTRTRCYHVSLAIDTVGTSYSNGLLFITCSGLTLSIMTSDTTQPIDIITACHHNPKHSLHCRPRHMCSSGSLRYLTNLQLILWLLTIL